LTGALAIRIVAASREAEVMKVAIFLPPFDELADPRVLADLAARAEHRGWDGFFVWDHITYRAPVQALADPWIALAAVAASTERLAIGPMVTPLARRRPGVVARQVASLDALSNGRLVFGVGLGGDNSREFSSFGEEVDDRRRAAMLDEGLAVLTAAWSGTAVSHKGEHYRVDDVRFAPTPVQRPHPPVWVAGRYGNPAPLRRAARWQGVFPIDMTAPDQLAEIATTVADLRGGLDGYDVVADGPPEADPRPWQAAGATWWLVGLTIEQTTVDVARSVIEAGPRR
jgi:alkanesulfonate monooxygenase SsuD/methylene tetrahydromethanopterin reductase-like flavin-dependent oxidoreductase (luciferase family)